MCRILNLNHLFEDIPHIRCHLGSSIGKEKGESPYYLLLLALHGSGAPVKVHQ